MALNNPAPIPPLPTSNAPDASGAIMIGDGLGTDVAAARAVGARSVLMLTGVTTRETVDAVPPDERPTAVAADAVELASILERLGA